MSASWPPPVPEQEPAPTSGTPTPAPQEGAPPDESSLEATTAKVPAVPRWSPQPPPGYRATPPGAPPQQGYPQPGGYPPGYGPAPPPGYAPGSAPAYAPGPGYPAPAARPAAPRGDMDLMAVVSLILGILGLVTCLGIPSPLALFLGLASRTKIREAAGVLRGSGLAMAGIVLGALGTVELIVVVVLVIVSAVRAG